MILKVTGSDLIKEVDTRIFTLSYFRKCMECTFCADACCNHGADAGTAERDKILARADEIKPLIPHPVEDWFDPDVEPDEDMPGGSITSTEAVDGRCVFRNPADRGCVLHTMGKDHHELKPMICNLFPITFDEARLTFMDDVVEGLVCAGKGDSLYRGSREEIRHYFGDALVQSLDAIEAEVLIRV